MKKFLIFILILNCSPTLNVDEEIQVTTSKIPTTSTSTPTTLPLNPLIVTSFEDLPEALVRIQVKSTQAELNEDLEIEIFDYEGTGSGFFISSDGYIVTNNHVVSGAVTIEVFTQYRSQPYSAKLIGVSECDDLAVLKIDIKDAKFLVFSHTEPKLGQNILAAGFPLGDKEVTFLNGIVSKKQTNGSTSWASIEYAFEHTAEILPGSSGGPIVDDNVKVLGIAYAGNEDRQEFGIPLVLVEEKIQLIINNNFKYSFKANVEQFYGGGLYIYSVDSDSPLRDVNIKGGELITKIKGLSITEESTLKVYCDALFARESNIGINLIGISLDTLEEFEVEVSLLGNIAEEISRKSIVSASKNNTTNGSISTTTTLPVETIDLNMTFENTPPIIFYEISGNEISDSTYPVIRYEIAPYIDLENVYEFAFFFSDIGCCNEEGWFYLVDTDLDGITDEVRIGKESTPNKWSYDYWLYYAGPRKTENNRGMVFNWKIKEEYYFMLDQKLLAEYGDPEIHFCFSDYTYQQLKSSKRGLAKYEIFPCPEGHFYIFWRGTEEAWNYSKSSLDSGGTYPVGFIFINNYAERVFSPLKDS